ncbi:hypothetical protein GCM10023176_33470 [Micromonospora coerulea]|uniref:Uncharacterized protein n=1 Tax=Micromonospora coerulea TaxID=47856 RepID=A0ABP8SLY1_9ACTN
MRTTTASPRGSCTSRYGGRSPDDDPDEEQGHFFQSVLLARPGYDDMPAEAGARLAHGDEPGY